jgi:hypothetical protein
MNIRRATPSDATAIVAIIVPIIREGTTYTLDPDMSELEALAYWMGHDKETFVAEQDGVVLGTYAAAGEGLVQASCVAGRDFARIQVGPRKLLSSKAMGAERP